MDEKNTQQRLDPNDLDQVAGGGTGADGMKTCPICGRSVAVTDFVNHIKSHPDFADYLEEIMKAMDQLNQQELDTERSIVEGD